MAKRRRLSMEQIVGIINQVHGLKDDEKINLITKASIDDEDGSTRQKIFDFAATAVRLYKESRELAHEQAKKEDDFRQARTLLENFK